MGTLIGLRSNRSLIRSIRSIMHACMAHGRRRQSSEREYALQVQTDLCTKMGLVTNTAVRIDEAMICFNMH